MDNLARAPSYFSMGHIRRVKADHGYEGGKRPVHFVAHWRFHRGMSQEGLAAEIGQGPNNVSQLENYKQGWSAEGLIKIAAVLETTPGALLMINPLQEGEAALWEAWRDASPSDRRYLGEIVPALLRRHQDGPPPPITPIRPPPRPPGPRRPPRLRT